MLTCQDTITSQTPVRLSRSLTPATSANIQAVSESNLGIQNKEDDLEGNVPVDVGDQWEPPTSDCTNLPCLSNETDCTNMATKTSGTKERQDVASAQSTTSTPHWHTNPTKSPDIGTLSAEYTPGSKKTASSFHTTFTWLGCWSKQPMPSTKAQPTQHGGGPLFGTWHPTSYVLQIGP